MEGNETITDTGNKDVFQPKNSLRRSPVGVRLRSQGSEAEPKEVDYRGVGSAGGSHLGAPSLFGESSIFSFTPPALPDMPQPFSALAKDADKSSPASGSSRYPKRKRLNPGDLSNSPHESKSETIMNECRLNIGKVMDFLVNSRKVNKEASSFLVLAVREIECQMNLLVQENLKLRSEISTLSSEAELQKAHGLTATAIREVVADALKGFAPKIIQENQRNPTFAEVIGRKEQQSTFSGTVLVKPSEKAKVNFKTPGEIEQEVKNKINPKEQNLKILNMRTTNTGVVIKAHNKEVMKKIMEDGELAKSGLQLVELKRRNPRLIVYDVPSNMTAENLTEIFWEQNANSMNKEDEVFRPIFRTGKRDAQAVNWVVEVSPALRKEILNEGRVFLCWESCRARDWTALTRCDKCHNFGHVKKHCESGYTYCGHCSERGHTVAECGKIQEPPKCINCSRSNKVGNHTAMDKSCEAYNRALIRYINNTNYG